MMYFEPVLRQENAKKSPKQPIWPEFGHFLATFFAFLFAIFDLFRQFKKNEKTSDERVEGGSLIFLAKGRHPLPLNSDLLRTMTTVNLRWFLSHVNCFRQISHGVVNFCDMAC